MILTPEQLPSRGIDTRSGNIKINPFTFKDLLKYTKEIDSAKDELTKFLVDFEWFKLKVDNWKNISLIDLDYILFLLKKNSVSSTTNFTIEKTCTSCGNSSTLYLDQDTILMPGELLYDIRGSIVLRDKLYSYEIPTLEVFDKVLKKITRFKKLDIELIYIISCFPDFDNRPNDIEDLVINAVVEDVLQLSTFKSMYFDSRVNIQYKCQSCNSEEWSMSIRVLIDQVFLSLLLSNRLIESKIQTKSIT